MLSRVPWQSIHVASAASALDQGPTRNKAIDSGAWLVGDEIGIVLDLEAGETVLRDASESEDTVMLVRVGAATDVSIGEMKAFSVDGTQVSVANVDGHLHAFDDTCPHADCSLAEGELEGTTVTCPCHGSQFDVTSGAVLHGPAQRPVRSRAVQADGPNLLAEV